MTQRSLQIEWKLDLRGVRTRPLRMAFVIATMPLLSWIPLYFVLPVALLLLIPIAGDTIPHGDLIVMTVFIITSGSLLLATWLMAKGYSRIGYALDVETLRVNPPRKMRTNPFVTEDDLVVDLNEISRVRFCTISNYTVARIEYPGWTYRNPYSFVVPRNRCSEVKSALEAAGVSISAATDSPPRKKLRSQQRCLAMIFLTICLLLVAPSLVILYMIL